MVQIFLFSGALFAQEKIESGDFSAPAISGGTTYYVSSLDGNDSWPGTKERPWKTLAKVSSKTYQPGDRILLKRGDKWVGQGLTLNGDGDYRRAWITLGAYGSGARPHLSNPPYHPDKSLVDWRSINKVFPQNPRYQMKVAVLIKGINWVVRDLEISHAEMGLLTKGNMGYWMEDLYIHNIGYDDRGTPLKEGEGGHLLYPKYPRWEEIEKETGVFPMWGDPSYPDPEWGNAIEINGEKLTVRNVVIEKVTGGIHGWGADIRVDNVFIDKVTTGGLTIGGADVKVTRSTVLNAIWPSSRLGWFGVCAVMATGDSSHEVSDSEIAYTGAADGGGDCCALEIDQGNSGVLWTRNFLHNNCGAAVEFGMAGPNQFVEVTDNVTYANGQLVGPHGPGPEFSGDASPFGAKRVTIQNNQIYKTIPGQYLNYYFGLYTAENPATGYSNDWSYPEKEAQYSVIANRVHEPGTYDLPRPHTLPAPERQNAARIADVTVSSGADTAKFAKDGNPTTEWNSHEEKPWLRLEWKTPQLIDEVWISDRSDLENWGVSGRLTLSDGWSADITGGVLNNGAPRKIRLDKPRSVTWIRYQITRTVPESPGKNCGLSEIYVLQADARTASKKASLPSNWTVDFEGGKIPRRLIGVHDHIDFKNTDWTVDKDLKSGNHFVHADFPRQSGAGPTWVIRYLELPWDSTVKSIKASCPEGTVVTMGQIGQAQGVTFTCNSELTVHETGWSVAKGKSNLIGFWIDVSNSFEPQPAAPSNETQGQPGNEKKPADVNDVWFDDIVLLVEPSQN